MRDTSRTESLLNALSRYVMVHGGPDRHDLLIGLGELRKDLLMSKASQGTCTDCKKQDGPCWCGDALGCTC